MQHRVQNQVDFLPGKHSALRHEQIINLPTNLIHFLLGYLWLCFVIYYPYDYYILLSKLYLNLILKEDVQVRRIIHNISSAVNIPISGAKMHANRKVGSEKDSAATLKIIEI